MVQAEGLAKPPGAATQPAARNSLRWLVFTVIVAANVMDVLDSTIVNVAGPSIRSALGGSASTLQWLSAGYTLAFAVFLITGARLGDMFGRRRLFLIGSAGFTLMSAACAAAPSPAVLIAFRVLQGAFGALMIPQGVGMLKETFAGDEIGKVFGAFGPMIGVSSLAAPILAGALVEANLWGIGWRLVFLINVPIGIAAFAGAVRVLPRTVAHPGIRLDIGGMVLVGLALAAILYPLIQGRAAGWPAWTFATLAAGAALLGAFVVSERRHHGDPLIEPGLLANRTYTSGILVALAFWGAFAGLLLCGSLFGQLGEGFSPIHAWLTLMAMVVGMLVGMGASFALVARLGRRLLHLGIAIVAAGTVVLALTVTGARTASTLDLDADQEQPGSGWTRSAPRPAFDFIVAGVGTASGTRHAQVVIASACVGRWPAKAEKKIVPRTATPTALESCCTASSTSGRRSSRSRRVRAHLPAADAGPRATDLTGRGKRSEAVAGADGPGTSHKQPHGERRRGRSGRREGPPCREVRASRHRSRPATTSAPSPQPAPSAAAGDIRR
jgi:EmrB/QacA subfamily drug resistance transporter